MNTEEESWPMPFGKHKGTPIDQVPADYLIWLYENNKCQGEVKIYCARNYDWLKKEAANAKKG